MDKQKTNKKPSKPINKKSKFIWFGVSMGIFLIGVLCAKLGLSFENYVLKSIYAVAVLFPLLVAAQKTSNERFDPKTKKRNIPAYVMYYLCIILFIVLLPIIFWVNQFVSL